MSVFHSQNLHGPSQLQTFLVYFIFTPNNNEFPALVLYFVDQGIHSIFHLTFRQSQALNLKFRGVTLRVYKN